MNVLGPMVITNPDKLCRVCLADCSEGDLKLLYENGIDFLLEITAGVKVMNGDGLPSNICNDCLQRLNAALSFRLQCQFAEYKLKATFAKDVQSSKPPKEGAIQVGDPSVKINEKSRDGTTLNVTLANQINQSSLMKQIDHAALPKQRDNISLPAIEVHPAAGDFSVVNVKEEPLDDVRVPNQPDMYAAKADRDCMDNDLSHMNSIKVEPLDYRDDMEVEDDVIRDEWQTQCSASERDVQSRMHGPKFECSFCRMEFSKRSELKMHMATHVTHKWKKETVPSDGKELVKIQKKLSKKTQIKKKTRNKVGKAQQSRHLNDASAREPSRCLSGPVEDSKKSHTYFKPDSNRPIYKSTQGSSALHGKNEVPLTQTNEQFSFVSVDAIDSENYIAPRESTPGGIHKSDREAQEHTNPLEF